MCTAVPAATRPPTTGPTALPHSMHEHDVRREHDESRALSLVPTFPIAIGAESYPVYRHESGRAMRLWVKYAFSDLAVASSDEDESLTVALSLANQELGRVPLANEARLLGEALRDILTAQAIDVAAKREDFIRRDEWLRENREGQSE